jgi:hypothetical protein
VGACSGPRAQDAQEATKKTPEGPVIWAVERTYEDSYRQSIVQLEFARRVAIAQIETATATKRSAWFILASVVVLALTGLASAAFQYLAWMYPHAAK